MFRFVPYLQKDVFKSLFFLKKYLKILKMPNKNIKSSNNGKISFIAVFFVFRFVLQPRATTTNGAFQLFLPPLDI